MKRVYITNTTHSIGTIDYGSTEVEFVKCPIHLQRGAISGKPTQTIPLHGRDQVHNVRMPDGVGARLYNPTYLTSLQQPLEFTNLQMCPIRAHNHTKWQGKYSLASTGPENSDWNYMILDATFHLNHMRILMEDALLIRHMQNEVSKEQVVQKRSEAT